MNTDNTILLVLFIIWWILFIYQVYNQQENKYIFILLHGVPHLLYSNTLLFQLLVNGNGGSAMAWWFYLLVILSIHVLILIGTQIYTMIQKRKIKHL